LGASATAELAFPYGRILGTILRTMPKSILLIKLSSLGDVVHGVPTLVAVRRLFPQAHIAWLVDERFRAVIDHHPALDQVIPAQAPRSIAGRRWEKLLRASYHYRVIPELRRGRFDLVLDLQGLFRTGVLAAATGARRRIGLAEAREGAPLFYTDSISAPWQQHALRRCLRLVELLGPACETPEPRIHVGPVWKAEARHRLGLAGLTHNTPYVVIAPQSSRPEKNWPPERFAELIGHLWSRLGLRSLLIGTGKEATVCNHIASKSGSPAVTITGVPLGVTMALIAGAEMLIANDSGPLHLAAALGRPLVGIYGPTDPGRVGPWDNARWVVQENRDCPACQAHSDGWLASLRSHRHSCLANLSVQSVLSRVEAALAAASAA
jgi:lipopolysaccharide heptosyltransferase I